MDGGLHNDGDGPRQVVTLSLFRFGPLHRRLWAFGQMGFARFPLRRLEGAEFVKLLGAGTGEGFTPVPDTAVMAVLVAWTDAAAAQAALSRAPVFRRLRDRAAETLTLHLAPVSVRGRWSAREPFRAGAPLAGGPVAALTRASIRPRALWKFWSQVPAISRRIGANRDVAFKIGIGEVPWLHQVTFSVWPDAARMAAFARVSGPHAEAIGKVRAEGWFSEELYARFAVLAHEGRWGGSDPLGPLAAAPVAAPAAR